MKYLIDGATLSGIADSIREKRFLSNSILASNMANEISYIPTTYNEEVTISSDVGGSSAVEHKILSESAFLLENGQNENLLIFLIPNNSVERTSDSTIFIAHGNKPLANFADNSYVYYGNALRWNSSESMSNGVVTQPVNGSPRQTGFRLDSSGNLYVVLPSGWYLRSGKYTLVMTCF